MSRTDGTTYNIKYVTSGQTYLIQAEDDVINCDTSSGVVTLYLPKIANIFPKRFLINDYGGNAGTNNIIVYGSGDTINGQSSFLFNVNSMSGEALITGQTEWLMNSDRPSSGSGTVTNFSFTNGGGFTGVVTNASTTPTLSLTIADSRITGSLLTGFVGAVNSPILATDTILQAFDKTQGQISAISGGAVSSVSGTLNRITSTPTTGAVVVDISSSYVGQTSITTVGTVTTGTWSATIDVLDTLFTIKDNLDTTKKAQFQVSGIATGTTRTFTFPNANGIICLTASATSGNIPFYTGSNAIGGSNHYANQNQISINGTIPDASSLLQISNNAVGVYTNGIKINNVDGTNTLVGLSVNATDDGLGGTAGIGILLTTDGTGIALKIADTTQGAGKYLISDASGNASWSTITGFVKTDGSTPMTGNWAAGAFSATHNSVIIGSSANTISMGSSASQASTISTTSNATKGTLTIGATISINEASKLIRIGTATTADALADTLIGTQSTTQKALVLQMKAAASANPFEIQTSLGANIFAISTSGAIVTGSYTATAIADTYILSATNWNTAYTNRITSLTVTGSSGASTLVSNTLNIPTYTANGLLPSQTSNSGKFLTTDGSNTSWATISSGTVTSVSVTTANGVSGTVATATTTPAITLTLGAITPTSVNGLTITTTTGTLTLTNSKTLSVSNTLTFAGTDSTTITFQGTDTYVGRTTTDTLTNKTLTSPIISTISNTGTLTLPTSTDTLVGRATTDTLTNKRITLRVVATTQSATPTINSDNGDIFEIVGLAQAITSMTTNLSGTPVEGQIMEIIFKDNATARAITWGASFVSSTATLPTTTVISTPLAVLLQYRTSAVWTATSAWYCIATA